MTHPFYLQDLDAEDTIELPPPQEANFERELVVTGTHPPRGNRPRAEFRNGGWQRLLATFVLSARRHDPGSTAARLLSLQNLDPALRRPHRVLLALGAIELEGVLVRCRLAFGGFDNAGAPTRVQVELAVMEVGEM
jgi:hypothetical protein